MKKTIAFAISAILLLISLTASVFAESIVSQSWYCVRNKEHKQPVADANMRYIEKYNGYYVDTAHGDDSEEKVLYLTFDAGYENGNVEKILNVLKQKDVTGAFFILGNLITKNTDLVRRMAEEGHLVCNHTSSHPDMTKKATLEEFEAELVALEKLYSENIGLKMPKYYRPPEGRFSEQTMKYANDLGYKTVFWSFAYADWENIHNGAVILLHPTSATNAAILGEVIDELKAKGYRFGTLDELTS